MIIKSIYRPYTAARHDRFVNSHSWSVMLARLKVGSTIALLLKVSVSI
jgi:hypothetical protein